MDLFSLLNDVVLDVVDPADFALGEAAPMPETHFGASPAPWDKSLDYHGDWDRDGIPNYADHWFGPGPEPLSFGAVAETKAPDELDQMPDDHVQPDDMPVTHEGVFHQQMETPLGESVLQEQIESSTTVIGDPVSATESFHTQEEQNSCAVAAQRDVIQAVLSENVPEAELRDLAEKKGWYDDSCGTTGECVGNILEHYGIPVDREYDHSLQDIAEALQRKERIIVALDASEITPQQMANGLPPMEMPDAGHAVSVTGVYQGDDGRWKVVINDPGYTDGAGRVVDAEHFLNAWDDFGRYAVITNTQPETTYVV